MIDVSTNASCPGVVRYTLRPNQSLSRRGLRVALVLVAIPSLSVSGYLALQGLWVPLPFAGLELASLTGCFALLRRRLRTTTVAIDLGPRQVKVIRHGPNGNFDWAFQAAWARIRLVKSVHRLHPKRLLIGAHGREIEIGEFLTDFERETAARQLRLALSEHSAWQRQN